MFQSTISLHDCMTIRGKLVKLVRQSTSSTDGKPVTCSCMLKYIPDEYEKLSYIFVGLLPWALIIPAYLCWDSENRTKPALALVFMILLTVYLHFMKIVSEKLIVIKDLGVQVTRTYFTGRNVIEFFPVTSINDVVLKQAVQLHQIVSLIGVQTQTSNKKLLFKPIILPKANEDALKLIYNDIQNVLLS